MAIDKKIDVLIVEDSAVTRQHLKRILESDPGVRVVAMARDGVEALELLHTARPSVVTMDIDMPRMNGLDATRKIMETSPVPIVIVSASYKKNDVEKSFLAMEAGAVAILEKPVGEGHPSFDSDAKNLVQTVRLMSEVRVIKRWARARFTGAAEAHQEASADLKKTAPSRKIGLVAIGASTGGPPVLQTVLAGLRKNFPAPIVVVQHIAKGFLEGMVDWLSGTTPNPVSIARHGEPLRPGHVYFAPDGLHLGVSGNSVLLSSEEPVNGIRPSVSYLFMSSMKSYGSSMAAVLLTGMGKDGAEELKMIKDLGGMTIAQDMDSCIVWGMPGEAVRIGGASHVLPPERIAGALESLVSDACAAANSSV